MSKIFGPVRQLGHVVASLETAIDAWLAIGVGPFFRLDALKTNYFRIYGVDVVTHLDLAIAHSGDLQIELVCQRDEAPTPYRDFLLAHGSGLQHLGMYSTRFDEDTERYRAAGFRQVIEGETHVDESTAIRFCYFSPGFQPGTLIEVADASGVMAEFNEIVRQASLDWDGSNPIRTF